MQSTAPSQDLSSPTVKSLLVRVALCLTVPLLGSCNSKPHPDAPKLTFPTVQVASSSVPTVSGDVTFRMAALRGDPIVEVATDAEYSAAKASKLTIGRFHGGELFRGNTIPADYFATRGEGKYWVRGGVDCGKADFGLFVSLIEMPIDERSGYLFRTEITPNGIGRRRYCVGEFSPFQWTRGPAPLVASANSATIGAGRFTVVISSRWRVVSGAEESLVRAEVKNATDQIVERYRKSSGSSHPALVIRHFSAAQFADRTGWLIVHEFVIPAQTDYYRDMMIDSQQKLDWGLKNGMFKQVIDNGITSIDGKKILKTTLLHKNGGRSLTAAYWTPKDPTIVTQLMVVQEQPDRRLIEEVDAAVTSLKIK